MEEHDFFLTWLWGVYNYYIDGYHMLEGFIHTGFD